MRKLIIVIALILPFSSNSQEIDKSSAFSKPNLHYELDKSNTALGISSETLSKIDALNTHPLNIAVFGVDRRNDMVYGNSDMIMIISIDQLTKKIKISSILRDTYVNINGNMDKINAAFANGGPQMAIRTINQNFDLDIREFVSIDFFGSAKIIDALGGVTLNVKKEEIPYLNNYLSEITPSTSDKLANYGLQKLNGRQTVAYVRIRATGNGDYDRTQRQRVVMASLLEKLRNINTENQAILAMDILPSLQTSMSTLTLYTLGTALSNSKNLLIEPAMFPLQKESKGMIKDGIWYLAADLKATTNSLHNFIYKNIKP
jgi:LCP family protein required for cell wall assembly